MGSFEPRACYCDPALTHVFLAAADAPRTIQITTYASGPGAPSSGIGPLDLAASLTDPWGDLIVEFSIDSGATWTPAPGGTLQAYAYHGSPDGSTYSPEATCQPVRVRLTPTGPSPHGTVQVTTPNSTARLVVHAITPSGLLRDSFVEAVDGTSLDAHAPDTKPAGGAALWSTGFAAIYGNQLAPGGNSGALFDSRIFAATAGPYVVSVAHQRGLVNATRGLLARAALVGTADFLRFTFYPFDTDTVDLSWAQVVGNVTVVEELDFLRVPWAVGETRRMWMRVSGATLILYLSDADGANVTVVKTVTLASPMDDSGHEYVGLAYQHYQGGPPYSLFDDFLTALLGLLVEPTALAFTAPCGSRIVVSAQVDVTTIPDRFPLTGLTATITYGEGAGWLTATPAGVDAPTTCVLAANSSGLAVGVYHATVRFDSPDNDSGPVDVAVTFTITQTPTITLTPDTLAFTGEEGGASPAAQHVAVSNTGTGTLDGLSVGPVVYGAGGSGWLAATIDPTTAPATVTLTPTLGALAAGTYTATVPVASTAEGVTNSPQSIAVTLVVTPLPPPPVLAVTPTAVAFTAQFGRVTPAAQTAAVTNAGEGVLDALAVGVIRYSAGAKDWLTALIDPTTAPAVVTLTPDVAGLPPGTYVATVPVSSSARRVQHSPQDVTVTLTVLPVWATVPGPVSGPWVPVPDGLWQHRDGVL